jgi:hypothetical protein
MVATLGDVVWASRDYDTGKARHHTDCFTARRIISTYFEVE